MAPIIDIAEKDYERATQILSLSGVDYSKPKEETQRAEVVSEHYIEVPGLNIAVAKERTHQNKNWYESHEVLAQEDARMLTIPEFAGFLNYLKSE